MQRGASEAGGGAEAEAVVAQVKAAARGWEMAAGKPSQRTLALKFAGAGHSAPCPPPAAMRTCIRVH